MSGFKKLLVRVRELPDGDVGTSLLKGFAEQLWVTWMRLKRRKSPGTNGCGTSNNRWMRQRFFEKLTMYCEYLGHKELING